MKITLVPVRMDVPLQAELQGEVLVLNGARVDLSAATEKAPLRPGGPWIIGEVRRVKGELQLELLLPHGADAPEETRFPAMLEVTEDGPLPLPPHDAPPQEAAPGPMG